jgi:hypothetical protein
VALAESRPDGPVYRVGHEPDPWAWTPWEYGPFTGRWDDPEDLYRVLYAASSPLGCFLEVLAVFRPDPVLAEELAAIEGGPDDDDFPTVPPGKVDRAWLERRRVGTATLEGRFVDVGHSHTIAELRPRFLQQAIDAALPDFDAAAIARRHRAHSPRPSRASCTAPASTTGTYPMVSSSGPATATTSSCGRSSSVTPTSGRPPVTSSATRPRR